MTSSSFLHGLNPQQRKAVQTVEGPVMVIAGPGSGKTRVLTYRIAYLIQLGVPAYNILALTFTNKAASEMKERIVSLVGEKSRQLWMGTFHSVFARILRREAEKIGFERTFSIYDTTDSLSLIKHVMSAVKISTQQFNPQAIRSRISQAKNQLILPEEYGQRAIDLFEEKTAPVYAGYQKQLRHNNAMDFDDLLLKPIELFAGHGKTLASYQDRFRFILIDEYQDTNRAQYVLIRQLAERYRNICVVGDDAQSIYAFRGADIRNILDFERDYPDAAVIRLEQNYRSTRTILAAADEVIRKNLDQITKNLWTDNHDGDPITILACEDEKDEGARIVSRIVSDCQRLKLDLKHFAVMYRTNAQSRSIEDALRRNGIAYTIVAGVEFYQRKEIKDVLAYLRLLVNPRDDTSFLRIVNYPARGLGDVTVGHLERHASSWKLSLFEAAAKASEIGGLSSRARQSLRAFEAMLRKYISLKGSISMSELSRSLVDEIGILRLFKEEGTTESMGRWENVQELLSAISEFADQQPGSTLEDFLQEVSLVSDIDEWDDAHNAVTLLTLHSAKGLEFPVVFIAGVEDGLLPFYADSPERKEVEEERRLYYVGITRAMRKLYLSHARVRYRFGDLTYQSPSRFLEEINRDRVEVEKSPSSIHSRPGISGSPIKRAPRRASTGSDSHYFSDEIPDYHHGDGILETLHVGAMVEHESFGRGKVLHIAGNGEAAKAIVDFQSVGRKNLLLKYARLKPL